MGCRAGIERNATIEDEARTVVVLATAFFEVLQNTAIELVDLLSELLDHRSGLFTANTASAKHDDRLLFGFGG